MMTQGCIANHLPLEMLEMGVRLVKLITRIPLLSKRKVEELEGHLLQMPEETNTLFTQTLIQKTSAKNTRKQDECLKRTLENEEEWEE